MKPTLETQRDEILRTSEYKGKGELEIAYANGAIDMYIEASKIELINWPKQRSCAGALRR